MTAPARQWLAGWLAGEGSEARPRKAAATLAALGTGAGAGWLVTRGWAAAWHVPDAGGGLMAAMAVVLAAGNGYAKAYSP